MNYNYIVVSTRHFKYPYAGSDITKDLIIIPHLKTHSVSAYLEITAFAPTGIMVMTYPIQNSKISHNLLGSLLDILKVFDIFLQSFACI